MRIPSQLKSIYFTAPALCLLVYITRVKPDAVNYFSDLALAFLHGRLDIIPPPVVTDLVVYQGKYYLYWPPVPALVFMPLVALFGNDLPDGLISSVIGALNVWLFMKICGRLSARFVLGLSPREIFWAGMFWGLGTVHFYMSRSGSVWFISQVMAQTFLLACVYFLLEERRPWLSGLMFSLAVYTRNDLIFSAIFLVFLYLSLHRGLKLRGLVAPVMAFLIPFLIFSALNLAYNYARFGNVMDNGLAYHDMDPYFRDNFNRYGYFSLHYVPYNFYREVFHPPTIILQNPFVKEDPEGFGFLWASPFFFWLFPAFGLWCYRLLTKYKSRHYWLMTIGSLAAAIPIAFVIFMVMGTGWRQFAARYTLDFQVFLLIFLLFSWSALVKIPYARPVSITLIVVSWLIQLVGAC